MLGPLISFRAPAEDSVHTDTLTTERGHVPSEQRWLNKPASQFLSAVTATRRPLGAVSIPAPTIQLATTGKVVLGLFMILPTNRFDEASPLFIFAAAVFADRPSANEPRFTETAMPSMVRMPSAYA